MKDVIVKKSKISGQGVFAERDFKKGEVVLKWNLKPLKELDIKNLSEKERTYVVIIDKKHYLMQSPERFVNHSCDSNTKAKNNCDVAVRNIKSGEEINSDYCDIDGIEGFRCKCGSKSCKGIIR